LRLESLPQEQVSICRGGSASSGRLTVAAAYDPKAPTLAFIHGGYWQMNDKESFAFFAEGLLPLGINLAVVEYTLAPAVQRSKDSADSVAPSCIRAFEVFSRSRVPPDPPRGLDPMGF